MKDYTVQKLELTISHIEGEAAEEKSYNNFVQPFEIFEETGYSQDVVCPKCQEPVTVEISSFKRIRKYEKLNSYIFLVPIFLVYVYFEILIILTDDFSSYGLLDYLQMIFNPIIMSAVVGGLIGLLLYLGLNKLRLLKDSGFEVKNNSHISRGGTIEELSRQLKDVPNSS